MHRDLIVSKKEARTQEADGIMVWKKKIGP